MTPGAMVEHLYRELELLGAEGVVVSSNMRMRLDGKPLSDQRLTDDPGVAVYFELKGRQQCIPCDKWTEPLDNLHAIGLALAAIRGFERWGTGQMVDAAFAGFTALSPGGDKNDAIYQPAQPWYEVLHVAPDSPREIREAAAKALRKKTHPDAPGGSQDAFERVQRAYEEAMK